MRANVNAAPFPIWPEADSLRDLARANHLAVARLEPAFSRRTQGAFGLDLVFARGTSIAVVPGIRVAHEMLVESESSPFLWPSEIADVLDAGEVEAIEQLILPWLLALTLAGSVNREIVRRFGVQLREEDFDRARAANFAGAACYADVAVAAAPYVYALRFARDARVGAVDASAGTGAAILARRARSVRAQLGDDDANRFATRWFGRSIYGAPQGEIDVGIGIAGCRTEIAFDDAPGRRAVRVATPVPSEIVVSFDPQDSPTVRTFFVRCPAQTATREPAAELQPHPLGGSSGRILMLLPNARHEYAALEDDAHELARRLRGEGFSAQIAPAGVFDSDDADLVHLFGLAHAREHEGVLRRARAAGVPVVATAALARNASRSIWGTRLALAIMSRHQDRAEQDEHTNLLALRRLGDADADPALVEPFPGYAGEIRSALAEIDSLIVTGDEEEAYVRSEFGYAGPLTHAQCHLRSPSAPAPIDEIVGSADFVLAHTPIHGNANHSFLARAAHRAGMPLVLAGGVADALFFGLLREELGADAILWPNPTEAEVEALYRRARVFADLSWSASSLHRLARAALAGCALVVSDGSYAPGLWPGVQACDPADAGAIESALHEAWVRGASGGATPAVVQAAAADAAFRATVSAYALAQRAEVRA